MRNRKRAARTKIRARLRAGFYVPRGKLYPYSNDRQDARNRKRYGVVSDAS